MERALAVNARFGKLAWRFGVLLPAGRPYRRRLGLSLAEQYLIEQLLSHYDERGVWRSFSQSVLGEELGISRSTVSEQLKRLRKLGLVATRTDSRFGTRAPTLFYCLEPYLAVLAMREGFDHFDVALWAEGNERLLRFAEDVEWGTWVWDVDGLETFRGAYLVKEGPKSVAVPASVFLADETAGRRPRFKLRASASSAPAMDGDTLSVPPTQEDSPLLSTSVHQVLEALRPKELKTLRISVLKNVDTQLVIPVGQQPEDSTHNPDQDDPLVEEEVSDRISKP